MNDAAEEKQYPSELFTECMAGFANNGTGLSVLAKNADEFYAVQDFLMDEGGLVWRDTGREREEFRRSRAWISVTNGKLTVSNLYEKCNEYHGRRAPDYRQSVASFLCREGRKRVSAKALLKRIAEVNKKLQQRQESMLLAQKAMSEKLAKLVIKRPNM